MALPLILWALVKFTVDLHVWDFSIETNSTNSLDAVTSSEIRVAIKNVIDKESILETREFYARPRIFSIIDTIDIAVDTDILTFHTGSDL